MNRATQRKILSPALLILLIAGIFAFTASPAVAQHQFLLATVGTKQGSIKGTSTVKGHEGWLEVDSAELGNVAFTLENNASLSSATGGSGAGKVKFNEFTIHKIVDSASPKLFQAVSSHDPVTQVTVECLSGSHMQAQTVHRLTITGGTMSVKPEGAGKEAIIVVGGTVAYN